MIVPESYAHGTPTPLVIMLHGYGASAAIQEFFFRMKPLSDEHGFLLLEPEGSLDSEGLHYWNATDACCDFDGSGVDDAGYLRALIEEAQAIYSVDPRRIYFVGHSNGGFMSHRMACDHADLVAAVVSLAGVTFADPELCKPSSGVALLQIHGDADEIVAYEGGNVGLADHPGTRETAERWAAHNGCGPQSAPVGTADFEIDIEGSETVMERYASGCEPSHTVELWTIEGGAHIPFMDYAFNEALAAFMLAIVKP
jgi:polyhydroxybutyrate depolymerase